eukprot:5431062-Prorocentrum_lima.AAC.1
MHQQRSPIQTGVKDRHQGFRSRSISPREGVHEDDDDDDYATATIAKVGRRSINSSPATAAAR